MFDKDNKFGFIINNNENSNNIKNTNLPYVISSKVLATVPASDITLDDNITVNNVSINKDRRYYIEFLGSKKMCNLLDGAVCSIGNYIIEVHNDLFYNPTDMVLIIKKINADDTTTTDTFTDLIIYEEEVKYLDNKYLENDLTLQNSISLGRRGDIGTYSSAIGNGVEASGESSHAEGSNTTASNYQSHAEGGGTTASGINSHAEGMGTKALAICSHAEGKYTEASGDFSHAEGCYTKASSENQHVQGKYNIEDTANKYAHIVGNGKNNKNRSNAHTLDWKGNGWFAGKLSQEGTPTEDKDLTTKKYVDDSLNNMLTFNENGELVVTINGVSKTFVPKE